MDNTIAWLLDGDPAIRWQALRDLADADADTVAAAAAEVTSRPGLTRRLLDAQAPDGGWGDEPAQWERVMETARTLAVIAPLPADARIAAAMTAVATRFHWDASLGGGAFFSGETEPCINGATLYAGGTFGHVDGELVERLLGEQLADGGWNCEAENGSTRSSFDTTLCVLEGLLAAEQERGGDERIGASRERAYTYLLDRGLLRRLSTGEDIDEAYSVLRFPAGWRYGVLRALDHLRAAGVAPDARLDDAVERVRAARGADGRWTLGDTDERIGVPLGETVGEPSRWITLLATRVLRWYDSARRHA